MIKKCRSTWLLLAMFFVCISFICGCSSGGDVTAGVGTGGTGTFGLAKLDITDAPASDYAHVFVTVTGVAFHLDSTAVFASYSSSRNDGWQTVRLPVPRTVDLARLSNGTMYADLNGNASLFSGITLPVGNYKQIRIFLASTEDAYIGSEAGLIYNNEVQRHGDLAHYPLRVPSSDDGIKVLPETPVVVTNGGNASLALDFDLNNDVVEVSPNGSTEYILKPRLGYFDMDRVGSINGTVSFSNLSTSGIEIRAEQKNSEAGTRIVRRATRVDKATGNFNLYPLPVFGNASTAVYDLLIRGRNVQTTIIKNITIHKGTITANGANVGIIPMQQGTQFKVQLASGMHPSGAWLNFYQTISGDNTPFEIMRRHLDPYTGKFGTPVELSNAPIRIATYNPGSAPAFSVDNSSPGTFFAIAEARDLYDSGASLNGISGATGQIVYLTLAQSNFPHVTSRATAGSIQCIFDMALMGTGMGPGMGGGNRNIAYPTKGQLFLTQGGMILDSIGSLQGDGTIAGAMHGGSTGNSVDLINLPSNIAGAYYRIYALGWGNGTQLAGASHGIDLRNTTNAGVTIKMK